MQKEKFQDDLLIGETGGRYKTEGQNGRFREPGGRVSETKK